VDLNLKHGGVSGMLTNTKFVYFNDFVERSNTALRFLSKPRWFKYRPTHLRRSRQRPSR